MNEVHDPDAAAVASNPPAPHRDLDSLEETLRSQGAAATIEELVRRLKHAGEHCLLLDALLLQARYELGLPLILTSSLAELPEPHRARYEERYIQAIRSVGTRILETGDIAAAWPYFRAIAEPEPIAAALEEYQPGDDIEQISRLIEIAFNQGAHPRRGFELILDRYGCCSAITALEQLPTNDPAVRRACVEKLLKTLHAQLLANLRSDLEHRGHPLPPAGTSILELLTGRDWLMENEAYHIDVSHLSAAVRHAMVVTDPAALELAADLAEYGRRLSPRLQFEGVPPFERIFDDHLIYYRALLGREVDEAIAHFRGKLAHPAEDDPARNLPAQVLVDLLARLNRLEEAIDVASEYLSGVPEGALVCPSLAELCQRAGRPDRLAELARGFGNPVTFLAGRLQCPVA
jgi:hypothetical protein